MLVSICIATYNGEKFIEETLTSIINQTYTDFEVVIVDDHSSDNTINIIADFCKRDKRIKLIVNATDENNPYADSHTKSYRYAIGELLFRFDQDDVMDPEYIEKMVSYMNEHPDITAACCHIHRMIQENDDWTIEDNTHNVLAYTEESINLIETYPTYYFWTTNVNNLFQIWHNNASVIRKSFLDENSSLNFNCAACGDYIFWLNAAGCGAKFGIVKEYLVSYKNHKDSTFYKSPAYNNYENEISQYYAAYYKYKGFVRYDRNIIIDRVSMGDLQDIFYNTTIFFRDRLRNANEWDKVVKEDRYE